MSSVSNETHSPPPFDGAPYDFSADTVFAMIESGLFPEEARVYLED
ncbi:MAG: hypothetical protein JWO68_4188, partial [Actinomycetia bacterium]|nr:hypothetical protein [Actinomycetes bacterium]